MPAAGSSVSLSFGAAPRGRARLQVRAQSGKGVPGGQMLVFVPPHPLLKHYLAICRNKETPSAMFRQSAAELGRYLIYEASREWLPVVEGQVETPLGELADIEAINPYEPVKVVPILRAGLILLDEAASVLQNYQTYHLGFVRDEETLLPSMYLNKLPESFSPTDKVMIVDPMLATGGTMMCALEEVLKRGADISNVVVVSMVACPAALEKMQDYKGLKVYTAMIDPELNDKGYIVPGLGDAGDRAFNTE